MRNAHSGGALPCVSATRPPRINNVRKYVPPRLEIPSMRTFPPVPTCRGVKPSQAANSRPDPNAAGSPMAVTEAVAPSHPSLIRAELSERNWNAPRRACNGRLVRRSACSARAVAPISFAMAAKGRIKLRSLELVATGKDATDGPVVRSTKRAVSSTTPRP